MSHIDSKQAQSYLAACEEGSIRAASERLGCEPSTVSRQIRALEKSLAIVLIERGRRGVLPTEAGRILLAFLKRQRDDLDALQSEFDQLRGMRRGEIIVAVGDGFISDFVGNALSAYRSAYPGFTYLLQSGSTDQVMHAVRTDRAHLGLAFNARRDRSIRVIAQVKQPLEMLVSPQSQWAGLSEPVSIRQLAGLPSALLMPGFGVGAMIREVEALYGVRFQSVVEANSLAVLRNFVREGLGVTILPAFVVTREIADGTIAAKRLDVPELAKGEASLFVRSGRRLPEGALRLANHAVRSMTAFVPS